MENFFELHMEKAQINAISNTGLAHIGDAVYELLCRSYLCASGHQTLKRLHADSVSMEILKSRISNTAMMVVAAVKSGLADEESMCRACRELLPPRILEGNIRLIRTVCQMMQEGGDAK